MLQKKYFLKKSWRSPFDDIHHVKFDVHHLTPGALISIDFVLGNLTKMKKIRKSLSQIPQKFLGAFGADFTITRSDVFMTIAAVLKNIRPVQPTSRRSKQTIHLRSNSQLVQDMLRGRAVVAVEDIFS